MAGIVWAALALSCLCAAAGQVLLKIGVTGRAQAFDYLNAPLIMGLAAYGIGLILWLIALSKLPLYVVYPFTFLTMIGVGVMGMLFLGERPAPLAYAGWAIMAAGLGLVWASSRSF